MTAADLEEYQPEWVDPITHDVSRLDGVGAAAEHAGHRGADDAQHDGAVPDREWGFHSTKALHVMIEAKKLAYADLIRYIGDPKFSKLPVDAILSKSQAPNVRSSSI